MHHKKILIRSAEELCRKAEQHRRLISTEETGNVSGNSGCSCENTNQKLRQAIFETIQVIEATKKSFKSRQLESLKKRLIETLTEAQ